MDHNKVVRAQEKLMKEATDKFELMANAGEIECMLFDGRKDITKKMFEIEG